VSVAFSVLSGCTKKEVKPEPVPAPVVVAPVIENIPVRKEVKLRKAPPPVVILVSRDIPAYQQVADELKRLVKKRATVVSLSAGIKAHKQLSALLKKPEYQQFVAIGLTAAKEAKRLAGREDEVVFCQVFNYQDYNLIGSRAKGIGALPGTSEMFITWSRMSPALNRVGVITGPGLENVIAAAANEASKHGIELQHKVVSTDKELLFEYKQMAPRLQGLWLLPDNRVLSGRIIKEVMSFSVRNTKQVAVFSEAILGLGGLLSVTTRPDEIAAKVAQRLREAFKGKGVPGPDMVLLEGGNIEVNRIVAKRYNLKYSEK
jgi:ABC-type uncharacterized transport system substrate-binding protein